MNLVPSGQVRKIKLVMTPWLEINQLFYLLATSELLEKRDLYTLLLKCHFEEFFVV